MAEAGGKVCGVGRRRSVLRMNWRRVGALRSFVFLLGEFILGLKRIKKKVSPFDTTL
jgi:hypothetical protein